MRRREFMGVMGAGAMGLAAAETRDRPMAQRPNILWITCEDIGPHLGCHGDDYARTPNLDAFAEEGVRYTHAFAHAPYERILDTAWLPVQGVAAREELLARLDDADSVVRYHAVLGLTAIASDDDDGVAAAFRRSLDDAAPVVRLAAADGLCTLGREGEATAAIREGPLSPDAWVRLYALNVLDRNPKHAEELRGILDPMLEEKDENIVHVAEHLLGKS